MSDPFSDIDKDVTLDKFKSLLYKYKKLIIILLAFIIVLSVTLYYLNHNKKTKDIRLSGYLIEIISIINTEDERAIKELKNSAPNKTRKIIPDVIAVLSITSKKDKKLKFLLKAAINPVPAAPIAAPSVGVKKPK